MENEFHSLAGELFSLLVVLSCGWGEAKEASHGFCLAFESKTASFTYGSGGAGRALWLFLFQDRHCTAAAKTIFVMKGN